MGFLWVLCYLSFLAINSNLGGCALMVIKDSLRLQSFCQSRDFIQTPGHNECCSSSSFRVKQGKDWHDIEGGVSPTPSVGNRVWTNPCSQIVFTLNKVVSSIIA